MILSGILTTPTGFVYSTASVRLVGTATIPFTTGADGSYSVNTPNGIYAVEVAGGFGSYAHLGSILVETGGSSDILVLISQYIADPVDVLATIAAPDGTTYIGHGSQTLDSYLDSELSKRVPTVFDFGAVGDGVTDDTAAIQAAINSTTSYLTIGNNPSTKFKVSRLIGRPNLKLVGAGILDFSGNATYASTIADPLFKFFGTASSPKTPTSDIAYGDLTINVDTSGIIAGDIIEIATPGSNGGFIDSSVAVHAGETREVASVLSPTQLVLNVPISHDLGYAIANSAQVRKLNTVNDVMIGRDITIKGKGRPVTGAGDNGIVFIYGRDVSVHCKMEAVDLAAVRFEGCYNYEASHCRILHNPQGSNTNVNYGIVPSGSSSYGRIHHNYLANMRHAVVTSHLSSALGLGVYGVSHDIDIYENTIVGTWHAAIATHNDADRVRITNNVIMGCFAGVNPRDRNVVVSDNYIRFCQQGILISGHSNTAEFVNNTIEDCSGSGISGSWDGVRDCTDIIFRGNKIIRCVGGMVLTLATPLTANSRITFQDNELSLLTGAGGSQGAIRLLGGVCENVYYIDNQITDCTGMNGIVMSTGGDDVLFIGNHVRGVTGNSITITGTYTKAYAKDNFVKNISGASALVNSATVSSDNTLYAD